MRPELQRFLLDALLSADPAVALRATSGLHADECALVKQIDPAGFHMASLLIRKLRMERLVASEEELGRLALENPEEFMRVFMTYHHDVPPTAYLPAEEKRLFRQTR